MKRTVLLVVAVLAIIVGFLLVSTVYAAPPYPEGVEVFTVLGETYILAPDGSVTHVCPCFVACAIPTPEPSKTITPTLTTPEPPDKQACNRGIGNDSEGCDPGNSSGQGGGQGRGAGEDRDEDKK